MNTGFSPLFPNFSQWTDERQKCKGREQRRELRACQTQTFSKKQRSDTNLPVNDQYILKGNQHCITIQRFRKQHCNVSHQISTSFTLSASHIPSLLSCALILSVHMVQGADIAFRSNAVMAVSQNKYAMLKNYVTQ